MINQFTFKTASFVVMFSLVFPASAIEPRLATGLAREASMDVSLILREASLSRELTRHRGWYLAGMDGINRLSPYRAAYPLASDGPLPTWGENTLLAQIEQARRNFELAHRLLMATRSEINQRRQAIFLGPYNFPAIRPLIPQGNLQQLRRARPEQPDINSRPAQQRRLS